MRRHGEKHWWENPPPQWYVNIGRYGVWVSLILSIVALILSIILLKQVQ